MSAPRVHLPRAEHYVIAAEHELAASDDPFKSYDGAATHREVAFVQAQLSTTAAILAVRDELVEIKNLLLAKAVADGAVEP